MAAPAALPSPDDGEPGHLAPDAAPDAAPEGAPDAASDGASGGAPGETLGERLVRTLDAGLASHRDVDELFAELAQMAGLEPEAIDDTGDGAGDALDAAAHGAAEACDGDFGDLEPLVQEYLWETGKAGAAATLELWVQLQRNAAVPRTDLELVTGQDLMRLLLHVYLAAPPAARAEAARESYAVLRDFAAWAQTTQELSLAAALRDCHGALLDQLDRLQAASVALSGAATPAAKASLLRVEEVQPRGFGVRTDEGGSHWIPADPATASLLRPGDLLLGALAPAGRGQRVAGPVVVLPADAEALIG
jgi:hypothetical protein